MYWEKSYKFLLFTFFALFFQTMSAKVFVIPDKTQKSHEDFQIGATLFNVLQEKAIEFKLGSVDVISWQNNQEIKEQMFELVKKFPFKTDFNKEKIKEFLVSEAFNESIAKLAHELPQIKIATANIVAKKVIDCIAMDEKKIVLIGLNHGGNVAGAVTKLLANDREFCKKKNIFIQTMGFCSGVLRSVEDSPEKINVAVELIENVISSINPEFGKTIKGLNLDDKIEKVLSIYDGIVNSENFKKVKEYAFLYKTIYVDSIKKIYIAACDDVQEYKKDLSLDSCIDSLYTIGTLRTLPFFIPNTSILKHYSYYYSQHGFFSDCLVPPQNDKTYRFSVSAKDENGVHACAPRDLLDAPVLAEKIIKWMFQVSSVWGRHNDIHEVSIDYGAAEYLGKPSIGQNDISKWTIRKRKVANAFYSLSQYFCCR